MSKRNEWEFEFSSNEVREGAKLQMEFRLERVKKWTAAKESVIAQIREGGLEITESVASKMAFYTSSGPNSAGPQVGINTDLQKKLAECHAKIKSHQAAVDEYGNWLELLSGCNPGLNLKLRMEDWSYFFSKR